MDKISKQEASVPVQTRVSVVSLAELGSYWETETYDIRTMSRLIAWSLDLLCEILRTNGKLPIAFEGIAEANRWIEEKGLYQRSLKKRAFDKIGTAIKFESLREQGFDPKEVVRDQYNMIHKPTSVEPYTGRVASNRLREATEIFEKTGTEIDVKHYITDMPREINQIENGKQLSVAALRDKEDVTEVIVKEGMSEKEFKDKMRELGEADKRQQEEMDKILGIQRKE